MKQKFFRVPFAQNGNTQVIPDSKSADGSVSFTEGWGEDYEKDMLTDANAKPVERKAMNAVLNDITAAIRALQIDSLPEWITTQDNAGTAFPYGIGITVRYNGKAYLSLVAGNTKTPGTDATKWQDVSGPVVRTVNGHGPGANGNVKLGTAADADVQTSQSDTTPGRLIPFGNYGLAPSLPAATGVDLNTLQTYGLYIVSNVKNGPFNGDIGAMFIYVSTWQSGTGTAGYRITQEAIGYGQSASTANRVARRSFNGTVWTGWQEFYSEAHKPTAVDINAADVRNNFAARMGVARVLTGANKPTSPGVWSAENSTWAGVPWGSVICTTNGSDLSTAGGSGKYNHYLQISHEAGGKPGLRAAINVNGTASGWYQVLMSYGGVMSGEIQSTSANALRLIQGGYGAILRMDANGFYILQTNKNDPNGNYNDKRSLTISNDTGAVGIGTQLTVTNADFINKVGYTTYKDGDGHDHHQVGGLRLEVDGSQMAELYYNVLAGQSAEVSLHNKYGTTDSYLSLRNDGQLTIVGSNPQLYLGSSRVASDGNIQGSCWGGDYLSNYLNNNFVRGIKIGPRVTFWSGAPGWSDDWDNLIPQGAVNIASQTHGDDRVNRVVYAYVMVNIGGNWVNAG